MKNIMTLTLVAVALGGSLVLSGCKKNGQATLDALEKDRFMVKVENAKPRVLEEEFMIVGSVKAKDEAVLFPRVSGKLRTNVLTEGDKVVKDQTVAIIERDEVGVVYEPAPVPSTLNGVVGRTYLDVGANVTPQTAVALIVDQSQVRVRVDVPERYLGKISLGQNSKTTVEAFPGLVFYGKVSKISPVLDLANRTVPLEILIDNPSGKLKSGMFAEVHLIVGSSNASVSVPTSALVEETKNNFVVFVPTAEDKAVRKPVTVGIKNLDFAEIRGGLGANQRVIVSGLYGLKDGSKISVSK